MHDFPHLQMFRAVVLDEALLIGSLHEVIQLVVRLIDRRIGRAGVIGEHGVGELLVVPGEPDQIVMPGDHPNFVEFVPVDRVFVPDPAVITVGIMHNVHGEHVVVDRRYHCTTIYIQIEPECVVKR